MTCSVEYKGIANPDCLLTATHATVKVPIVESYLLPPLLSPSPPFALSHFSLIHSPSLSLPSLSPLLYFSLMYTHTLLNSQLLLYSSSRRLQSPLTIDGWCASTHSTPVAGWCQCTLGRDSGSMISSILIQVPIFPSSRTLVPLAFFLAHFEHIPLCIYMKISFLFFSYHFPLSTLFFGNADKITGITWSPDSSMFATCSMDKTAKIWRVPTLSKKKK